MIDSPTHTPQAGATPALQAENIVKVYDEGPARIEVLSNVSLSVARGEMVAIVGASGSGKSTLLHILGLLDVPTSGSITVDGQLGIGLSESRKSAVRNRSLGFVYQFHHLLAEFSALDNVAMPLIVRRENRDKAREAAREVLGLVGLSAREGHFPGQLSGGERQRVALARALVTRPVCVLADEPTGNLDRHTAHNMFELLTRVNQESGTAFAIVTHDPELAARADRQLLMENGRLVSG
ncbi:ATP-binding cassette domain-containing protein [Achromobacter mucicolens]|jgi:lipoprotein-releasing system ATP-binding protein|uniref:ATP-binding cassette domain-containing protein n=2 Tax=Achromobacter mucicolens TaxID=1389922 RepID=A0ABD4YMT8_9BURK|nr:MULTISPECIES: ATP-binding cassette domain-containing protein [Achromobacter]KRB16157.1 lipoprotein ABC transporter ATP-binding protein [Achromobacter sp. Root170]MCP2515658.1 ATP-binding cassette domain-containing protein [Achromobacter mucicolens]MCU6618698.1 ATP-binding cassette domain-containing protein [Achromobacter mucicolens]MDH1176762.1 ATP-binding cassette domain-containing protein [Achromobacter mucicolens]TQJ97818.1 lipoprotein-releasing system ATP-binding protein [Achromobacter 